MAITRKESLLKSISGGESANLSPITREEQYLSYIAGESNSYPIEPITREEMYLDSIAKSGISGGSGVNVQPLSVTENGTYTAPSGIAYSPIFVDVDVEGGSSVPTQEKTVDITENGTTEITADEGYLLSKVTANVNVGGADRLDEYIMGNITEINSNATTISAVFQSNKIITSVNFPLATTTTVTNPFQSCSSIKEAFFGQLKGLRDMAFAYCSNLNKADFTVLYSISGNMAFGYCSQLKALILRNNERMCALGQVSAFNSSSIASGTGYVYVPRKFLNEADATSDYRQATNWSTFATQFRALEDYTVDGTITGELDSTKI